MSRTYQPSATCPDCSVGIDAGQPFCGACGRRLQSICPDCGASNPPHFHFCGQCGGDLSRHGSLAIDSGGLIREVNAPAADILGHPHDALIGKPFSLLVDTDDLVVFFTHWNRLIGSGHPQSLAIDLRSSHLPLRHLKIQMHPRDPGRSRGHFRFEVNDISDLRRYQNQCQDKEDLVNLIEEIIDGQSTPSIEGRQAAAKDHLAKICLYVGSGRGFAYRIGPNRRHLHSLIEWRMPEEKRDHRPRPLAVDRIPALWRRLVQNGHLVMDASTPLPESEKKELAAWRGADEKAFICRVIHRGRRPAGFVGMADHRIARWSRDAGALLKLASRLLEWALPEKGPSAGGCRPLRETRIAKVTHPGPGRYTIPLIDLDNLEEIDSEATVSGTRSPHPPQPVSGPSRSNTETPKMEFETDPIQDRKERQRVLKGADGSVQVICPVCGFRESTGSGIFKRLGFALRVKCPAGHRFSIIREQRNAFRKSVQLEGYASRVSETDSASDADWWPVTITNLSKFGLQFVVSHSRGLSVDDRVTVRFNLDNPNNTLIKKSATVKKVKGGVVGCRFDGQDRYDVTLGFYLL
jgi:hypothetical protein